MSEGHAAPPEGSGEALTAIQFHYIKSSEFRVVYADGAIGSPTPSGKIFFSFYNERAPLPRVVTHQLTSDGQVGDLIHSESRAGVVREVEVGIIMDVEVAKRVRDFISQRIDELERALGATQNADSK